MSYAADAAVHQFARPAPGVRSVPFGMVLATPLAIAGLVDVPRALSVGGVTLLGALAIGQLFVVAAAILVWGWYPRRLVPLLLPYGLFAAWVVVSAATAGGGVGGMQNAVVYLLFGGCVTLASISAATSPERTLAWIERGMRLLDIAALPLMLISFLMMRVGGAEYGVVGMRGAALVGVMALAWHLARWHTAQPGAGPLVLLWLLSILISESRTASAVAVLEIALTAALMLRTTPARLLRRMPLIVTAAVLVLGIVVAFAPQIMDRFLVADTNVMTVGGVEISSSGRSNLWPAVIESAWRHPFIGGGLGSSQFVSIEIGTATNSHPHNDYLRIWHELGFIGLGFFVAAMLLWLLTLTRTMWRATGSRDTMTTVPAIAGFLAVLSLALVAITDNAVIYTSVMGPAGVLIGCGLGVRSRTRTVAAAPPAWRRTEVA